jgi:hypothetical protein
LEDHLLGHVGSAETNQNQWVRMVCLPWKIPGAAIRLPVEDWAHILNVFGEIRAPAVKGLRDEHKYELNCVPELSSDPDRTKSHRTSRLVGYCEILLVPYGATAALPIYPVKRMNESCRWNTRPLSTGERSPQHKVHHHCVGGFPRQFRFEIQAHPLAALQLEQVCGVEPPAQVRTQIRPVTECAEIQPGGFNSRLHRLRRENTHTVTCPVKPPTNSKRWRNVSATIPRHDHKTAVRGQIPIPRDILFRQRETRRTPHDGLPGESRPPITSRERGALLRLLQECRACR